MLVGAEERPQLPGSFDAPEVPVKSRRSARQGAALGALGALDAFAVPWFAMPSQDIVCKKRDSSRVGREWEQWCASSGSSFRVVQATRCDAMRCDGSVRCGVVKNQWLTGCSTTRRVSLSLSHRSYSSLIAARSSSLCSPSPLERDSATDQGGPLLHVDLNSSQRKGDPSLRCRKKSELVFTTTHQSPLTVDSWERDGEDGSQWHSPQPQPCRA